MSSLPSISTAPIKFEYLFFEGVVTKREKCSDRRGETLSRAVVPAAGSEESERFFARLLAGVDLPVSAYRARSLTRRLPACLRLLQAKSTEEAMQKLAVEPRLAAAALSAVLLGVTEFFRDRAVFEHLRRQVLPGLLSQGGPVRIWSAACSEGQELYSVAMLLAELGRLGDCELWGTDCRSEAIERAQSGRFAVDAMNELDVDWRERYFTRAGAIAAIDGTLRAATRWRVADLLAGVERGPWQLILWRNMAIYLETMASDKVWQSLCDELAPGGFLVAGKADHPPKWLPLRRVVQGIYQKADL